MKKNVFYLSAALAVLFLTVALTGYAAETTQEETKAPVEKKGILVASFGTSYAETRKVTIEACEDKIRDSFPEYEVRRAFTSSIIRKIMQERDHIQVDSVEEALTKMKQAGFTEVIVQPLHIIPGVEYNEVLDMVAGFKDDFASLVVGRPILTTIEDYDKAVAALKTQIQEPWLDDETEAVVFMGHGTHHPANASYACLQLKIWQSMPNVFIGTVEGYPALDDIIPLLKEKGIKRISLMPYMVVAGDHAQNDMAGDEEDSWKSILKEEGFYVNTYLQGLGENAAYQQMYVDNIQDCIAGHPLGQHEEE
ncbi:MAG: sirohydrochlorin cobaltochelatase [Peptococcaceae bacterium]